MDTPITDTDRMDWLCEHLARSYGQEPEKFREHIDEQITSARLAALTPRSEWINVADELPPDDLPVRLQDDGGGIGKGSYCSVAGQFYCADEGIAGLLWTDVHGPEAKVTKWRRLS